MPKAFALNYPFSFTLLFIITILSYFFYIIIFFIKLISLLNLVNNQKYTLLILIDLLFILSILFSLIFIFIDEIEFLFNGDFVVILKEAAKNFLSFIRAGVPSNSRIYVIPRSFQLPVPPPPPVTLGPFPRPPRPLIPR